MLVKRIIPCLDVKDGRVVKGVNFVNLRDAGDPVEVATAYEKEGADELTFLDITASHEKRDIILDVVARTAEKVFMPLTCLLYTLDAADAPLFVDIVVSRNIKKKKTNASHTVSIMSNIRAHVRQDKRRSYSAET